MALTVEDGTGKEDSQTYASAAEIRSYALLRGVVLPAVPGSGPDPVEAMAVNAMDYLEAQESMMKGKRTDANAPTYYQALSFPRAGLRIGCAYDVYPDDKIPPNLVSAQCQLVIAIHSGVVLQPVLDPNLQLVKREKVDVLETEFFSPKDTGISFGTAPVLPAVDALLRPLLRPGGSTAPAYRA